jgi:hypothetical protein
MPLHAAAFVRAPAFSPAARLLSSFFISPLLPATHQRHTPAPHTSATHQRHTPAPHGALPIPLSGSRGGHGATSWARKRPPRLFASASGSPRSAFHRSRRGPGSSSLPAFPRDPPPPPAAAHRVHGRTSPPYTFPATRLKEPRLLLGAAVNRSEPIIRLCDYSIIRLAALSFLRRSHRFRRPIFAVVRLAVFLFFFSAGASSVFAFFSFSFFFFFLLLLLLLLLLFSFLFPPDSVAHRGTRANYARCQANANKPTVLLSTLYVQKREARGSSDLSSKLALTRKSFIIDFTRPPKLPLHISTFAPIPTVPNVYLSLTFISLLLTPQ